MKKKKNCWYANQSNLASYCNPPVTCKQSKCITDRAMQDLANDCDEGNKFLQSVQCFVLTMPWEKNNHHLQDLSAVEIYIA